MSAVRFVFGLHLHQPWGNFDHVVKEHVDQVYRPILTFLEDRELLPMALHASGPLLEWLETHDVPLHDRIGRLANEGTAELLTAGLYEPILAALSRADRAEQLEWMGDYLKRRFGVTPRTAWLTERVFESDLIPELARAGVENLLVDDWHLMAGGLSRTSLHGHYRTEGDGHPLTLVPIHESLRYLVPFQPADAIRDYFVSLRGQGQPLAVLGDDGEKFGGWPGTKKRVWDDGWIEEFAAVLTELRDDDTILFSTVAEAVRELPCSGIAYLPTASYREMGEWALPPELTEAGDHPFAGTHWKNFLVRYPEANQLHKKALVLSRLCRARNGGAQIRRAIGRAQCNDPYWHGVFGGVYMKHLRDAAWKQLALAEGSLRSGEDLEIDVDDVDFDGEDELWIHSQWFSALVGSRSGRFKELTHFGPGFNYADVLTRRWEAYHGPAVERGRTVSHTAGDPEDTDVSGGEETPDDTSASIHDLEDRYVLAEPPFVDRELRSLVVERVVAGELAPEDWEANRYEPLWTWPSDSYRGHSTEENRATLRFSVGGNRKILAFTERGDIRLEYKWDGDAFPETAQFAVEVSVAHPLHVTAEPEGRIWTYPIVTVPRSERGFERITQGESITVMWPARQGGGVIHLLADYHV